MTDQNYKMRQARQARQATEVKGLTPEAKRLSPDEFHDYWNMLIKRYIDNQNKQYAVNQNILTTVNQESANGNPTHPTE